VYKELIEPGMEDLPKTVEDGLRMMCRNEKMAYFNTDTVLQVARNKKTCSILAIDMASYPVTVSIAISKKSPYKRLFNAKYVQVSEVDLRRIIHLIL
jgi:hypothetical protein